MLFIGAHGVTFNRWSAAAGNPTNVSVTQPLSPLQTSFSNGRIGFYLHITPLSQTSPNFRNTFLNEQKYMPQLSYGGVVRQARSATAEK